MAWEWGYRWRWGREPWCPSGHSSKWRDGLEEPNCKGAVLKECMVDPPTSQV